MNAKTRIILRAAAMWVASVAVVTVGWGLVYYNEADDALKMLWTAFAVALLLASGCIAYLLSEDMEDDRSEE